MSDWSGWIGREERREDRIEPGAVRRWLATLDRDAPADGTVAHTVSGWGEGQLDIIIRHLNAALAAAKKAAPT